MSCIISTMCALCLVTVTMVIYLHNAIRVVEVNMLGQREWDCDGLHPSVMMCRLHFLLNFNLVEFNFLCTVLYTTHTVLKHSQKEYGLTNAAEKNDI